MLQFGPVKARALLGPFWIDGGWIFIGVPRQGAERFDFSSGRNPFLKDWTRLSSPRFKRDRDLSPPQEDGSDGRKKLIASGVKEVEQAP